MSSPSGPLPGAGRNMGNRGSTMAIACGTAIAALFATMYYKGRDVKSGEGQATVYSNQGHGIGGGDKAMTSSDVSNAVTNGFGRK